MASAHDRRQRSAYRLDIAMRDGVVLLHVTGSEGPGLRQHVAEVERAAKRCGLRLAIVEDGVRTRGLR